MANTHDYIISNNTGSIVRADFNVLFLEIEASNAGDSAPSNVAAGKLWHDTTTDTLKYYTGSDWVSVARATKSAANNTDITGTIDPAASTTVPGVSTIFTKEAKIGDKLVVTGETRTITAIASDTSCTVDVAFSNNSNDTTPEIHPAAFVVTDDSNGIDLLVDTDGKVGVNCATPGAQLDVRGPAGTGTASAGVLRLSTAELTVADADQLGRIEFIAPLEASGTDAILVGASIYAEADDTFASGNNATELVFATGASEAAAEKMRITSDGNIGIGVSDPDKKLEVNGIIKIDASVNGDNIMAITNSHATGFGPIFRGGGASVAYFLFKVSDVDGTEAFRIDGNNTFVGSSSADISDERLKENITTITGSLATINALKGRTFTWKPEAKMQSGIKYGLIAQELESVIPDLVYNKSGIRKFDADGNLKEDEEAELETDEYAKSITMTGVIPILVEAVKELSAKVTALESA